MASKKAGKAAGLAALAGLAYMASRDKQGGQAPNLEQEEATSPRDRMPAASAADQFDVSGEGGYNAPADMSRVERVGTPAAAIRMARAPATAPTAPATSGAYRSIRSDMSNVGGGRSGGRGGAEAGEEAAYKARISDGGKSMIDRQNAAVARANRSMTPAGGKPMTVDQYYDSGKAQMDKEEGTFKRGGKVKKMASGGMTSSVSSASRRADGIATKGKTRGKMY